MFKTHFDVHFSLMFGSFFDSKVSKYEERRYCQIDRYHYKIITRLSYISFSLEEFTYLPPDGFVVVKL